MDSDTRYSKLKYALSLHPKLAIAYSGGVDSAFLLRSAIDAGCDVMALTAVSELIPEWEQRQAAEIATELGARHVIIRLAPLDDSHVYANSPERCYYCKKTVMSTLKQIAVENGFPVLIEGTNSTDSSDYRPGMKAVREEGVVSPLLDLGFVKSEIRELSSKLGIPGYDRPSCACLASRIPYGTELSASLLSKVERAEICLRNMGFEAARVRVNGDNARIEIPVENFARIIEPANRREIVAQLSAVGFVYISLDLSGYRSGSMNDVLDRR